MITGQVFEIGSLRRDSLPAADLPRHLGTPINRANIEWNQLAAVHLTDTLPVLSHGQFAEIHPTYLYRLEASNFKIASYDGSASDKDKLPIARLSVHMTFNHAVDSHMMGGWDQKKIAIVIPAELIKERFRSAAPIDAFVVGRLPLPRGSVIVAEEGVVPPDYKPLGVEIKEVSKGSVKTEVSNVLKDLGFTRISGGVDYLPDEELGKAFSAFQKEEGLSGALHYYTRYAELEKTLAFVQVGLKELAAFRADSSYVMDGLKTYIPLEDFDNSLEEFWRHCQSLLESIERETPVRRTLEEDQALRFQERMFDVLKERVDEYQSHFAEKLCEAAKPMEIAASDIGSLSDLHNFLKTLDDFIGEWARRADAGVGWNENKLWVIHQIDKVLEEKKVLYKYQEFTFGYAV